jgi:hypothetical protein
LDRTQDRGLLSIRHRHADEWLVADLPIALHGWDPAKNPNQGILIDARRGAWASIDELSIHAEDGSAVASWDWESESFQEGIELSGHEGWNALTNYCEPGGMSVISSKIPDPKLEQMRQAWEVADRAKNRTSLKVDAALAKLEWLQARLADWQSRTQAEEYRYRSDEQVDEQQSQELAKVAHQAQHRSKQCELRWKHAQSLSHLAQTEALPSDTADLTAKIGSAKAELRNSAAAWETARSEACDPNATTYEPLSRQYPRTSSGRRTALAHWITNRRNPLTARVAVNHLWMRHFHQPLVASVFDFGRNGAQPSHPELLDWLAVEFMESGWSMKHLHRMIVTSDAYRRVSSSRDPEAMKIDPENRWLWRMNTGRMEAESLRDSVLSIAGKLNEIQGGQELENQQSLTTYRRSIYYSCQPEDDGKSPLGAIFDGPDANECYRRTRTIVPQQSLALTNSDWVHALSDSILEQIDAPKSDAPKSGRPMPQEAFVQEIFLRILGRQPREEELRVCMEYLANSDKGTRASLIRVLLNHNDFVTIR